MEMMLVGNLNARLVQPHENIEKDLTTTIIKHGLEEQIRQLIPCRRFRGGGGGGVDVEDVPKGYARCGQGVLHPIINGNYRLITLFLSW